MTTPPPARPLARAHGLRTGVGGPAMRPQTGADGGYEPGTHFGDAEESTEPRLSAQDTAPTRGPGIPVPFRGGGRSSRARTTPWVRVALVVAASVLASRPAAGQSYSWTGSVNGNWSTPNDWSPAGPPTSSINTALTFGATGNPVMTNDLAGTFSLNSMRFEPGAPAYTLGGNPLSFQIKGEQ